LKCSSRLRSLTECDAFVCTISAVCLCRVCAPERTGAAVRLPACQTRRVSWRARTGVLGSTVDRARRGGSGALHPQSALAGPNSPPRGVRSRSLRRLGLGSRAVSACEPGQVRKEAALSDPRQAQRAFPIRSRERRSAAGCGASTGGARSTRRARCWAWRPSPRAPGSRLPARMISPYPPPAFAHRWRIRHERLVRVTLKPVGTATGWWGSLGSRM
jgi:hypothetical protein